MTSDSTPAPALGPDEVLVYVGEQDAGDADEYPAGIRTLLGGRGVAAVTIDDAELDRLRAQVSRIATKLESDGPKQGGFGIDSITLHVGINASGHFFFVASAGVEAAIDITWTRKH
jgi:hypothetical protein